MSDSVGVVVIGRNEGERLQNCLRTISLPYNKVVYVDSGSVDDSIAIANSLGITVLKLDMSIPFSAGRARNEGFERIMAIWPDIKYVQFLDGDCVLENGWLSYAENNLSSNSSWAIAAGGLRERFPDKSIYNLLCDMEWNGPIGKIMSCGGLFMTKSDWFRKVGGFNSLVIAGEEPELCYRIRKLGGVVYRLDSPMAIHDASMTRFGQWWTRCVRSGCAYAQGVALHGKGSERFKLRESVGVWFWTIGIFLLAVMIARANPWLVLLIMSGIYLLQYLRIVAKNINRGGSLAVALAYGLFIVLAKWPQLLGQIRFIWHFIHGRRPRIIEYK